MPKINVYLPDDLADAVRDAGIPVSPVCQRALEQAVRRAQEVRDLVFDGDVPLGDRLTSFTARTVSLLERSAARARESGAPDVTTGDLLHGMLTEPSNLALQVLGALEVDPATLTAPADPEPPTPGAEGLRLSQPAAAALELTVGEAIGLGHNYVGSEHLLIGLVAEGAGAAGALLRSRGLETRTTRRAVAAAVAGYAHLRATSGPPLMGGLRTILQGELAPLIARIERLEAR